MMIFATGSNYAGQLGLGARERENKYIPSPFGCSEDQNLDISQVKDLQCGSHFTVTLMQSGAVQICGTLNGKVYPYLKPVEIALPLKCIQIACGRNHIVALMERSVTLSWGSGLFGQLGHGDDVSCESPRVIKSLSGRVTVTAVACGGCHSGVLTDSDKVLMWGLNRSGQCGISVKMDSVLEPQAIVSSELGSQKISGLVCGRNHSALLTASGRLYVWGENTLGRLGIETTKKIQAYPVEVSRFRSNPVQSIASGNMHMLALTRDGSVYSWGYGADGATGHQSLLNVRLPRRIPTLDGLQVIHVACGDSWSAAVTIKGQLLTWGYGEGGCLGMRPPGTMPYIEPEEARGQSSSVATLNTNTSASSSASAVGLLDARTHSHVRTFSSAHCVLSPQRVKFLEEDWACEGLRMGASHMLVFCSSRVSTSDAALLPHHETGRAVGSGDGMHEQVQEQRQKEEMARNIACGGSFGYSNNTLLSSSSSEKAPVSSKYDAKTVHHHLHATCNESYENQAGSQSDALQMIEWSRLHKTVELSKAIRDGIDPNISDAATGNTPLIVACQNGHFPVVRLLVDSNANINQANKKGNSPLHYCFNYGFEEIAQYLIDYGADEYVTNLAGLTCYEGLTQSDLNELG